MEPGTYTTVFQPKITFTTDASWVSYADTPDFVWFERPERAGLRGNGGIGFKRIDKVLDPTDEHAGLMPVPKDYVGWIVSLPGVKVLAGPKAVTVDGVAATVIDVTATNRCADRVLQGSVCRTMAFGSWRRFPRTGSGARSGFRAPNRRDPASRRDGGR